MTEGHEVSIIIPAFNEENGISDVVNQINVVMRDAGVKFEVIIVDDGSSDNTAHVAKSTGARVLRHVRNIGYGAALKTGIRQARYSYIAITDADGTYPIDRIPEMLKQLDDADMVVGSRTGQNVHAPLIRKPAKWILRQLAGYITGHAIPDLNSGLRVFRRECVLQYFSILSDRFSFTTTITVAMLCDNYLVTYIPIDYFQRVGKSKIVPWDFVTFTNLVLRLSMLFNPLKVFVPAALVFFAGGFSKFAMDVYVAMGRTIPEGANIFTMPLVSTTAVILLLGGLQILLIGMMSDGLARKIAQHVPSTYQSLAVKSFVEES